MEATKYTPIRPGEMFRVTVEVVPSECRFLNQFAALVIRYGNRNASFFAPAMGVGERQLTITLQTLSGAGIRDWTDAHGSVVAETLLRETNWEVGRIGRAAHFLSAVTFSRFFRRTHGSTPAQWRWSNKP